MSLHIFHTNDLHSNYTALGSVEEVLCAQRGAEDLYFDSGDFTDLKSPVVDADKGGTALTLLTACGLDAMAVGNNEIDLGYDALTAIARQGVPFVCANLTDNASRPVPGVPASRILERQGVRILVLGAAPYYNKGLAPGAVNVFFRMGNLMTVPPEVPLRRELERQKGRYDFCILLTHSGEYADSMILPGLPEVDLCLSGHDHQVITRRGYSSSGKGECLGCVTLEKQGGGFAETASCQIPLTGPCRPEFTALLTAAQEKAAAILGTPLPALGGMDFHAFDECFLVNFIADALHKLFESDLALMHSGIADGPLTLPISRKSLLETLPSKLNPTLYTVTGAALLEAARQSLDPDWVRQHGQGPGFRGTVLGTLGFSSNVRVSKSPFGLWVDGCSVTPERQYRIAADDYLQRGCGYPSLRVPDEAAQFHRWFIRDLVENSLTDPELYRTAAVRRQKEEA